MLTPQLLKESEQQDKTKYKPAIKNQTSNLMCPIKDGQFEFQTNECIDQQPKHRCRKRPHNSLKEFSYFWFQE